MTSLRATVALLLTSLAACGPPARFTRHGGAFAPLVVTATDGLSGAPLPPGPAFVATNGGEVVVFHRGGATVLEGSAVVAVDRSVPSWVSAATVPAADGAGPWVVGVAADGRVYRVRARGEVEPVSDRYGLAADRVRAVAWMGGRRVAFAAGGQLALSDGDRVVRYGVEAGELVGGGGRAAWRDARGVFVVDGDGARLRFFPLEGARFVALDGAGRLYAATDRAVYAAGQLGTLELAYAALGPRIGGLAAATEGAWFIDDGAVGRVDASRVALTAGRPVPAGAVLQATAEGDVWLVGGGVLRRLGLPARPDDDGWDQGVRPVFARVCARCHTAGGEAGVDLSTRDAWRRRRAEIVRRVLESRSMPPPPSTLRGEEIEALRHWLAR